MLTVVLGLKNYFIKLLFRKQSRNNVYVLYYVPSPVNKYKKAKKCYS